MGFRNPVTTAADVDTGTSPTGPGVRLYQDTTGTFPRGVAEFRSGVQDEIARLELEAFITVDPITGVSTSVGNRFTMKGAPAQGRTPGRFELDIQEKAAGGYESVAKLTDVDRLEVPKLAVLGPDTYNAGTQGLCAGVAPPAGQPLLAKIRTGTFVGNGAGDVTVTFPGGAFPNGLIGVWVDVVPAAAPGPYEWSPWGPTLSSINLRCFQYGSSVAVGGPTLPATILAIGW